MWKCPKCGNLFFQKNLWHSCGHYTVKDFLKGRSQKAIDLFDNFLEEYRKIGPFILSPAKTRIALMVAVRFAGISTLGKDHIGGAFWLKKKCQSKKFYKIEQYTKNDYGHFFRIYETSDIDNEFRKYMKMAYEVGQRTHIKKKKSGKS
jgi:hypothetical protein